MAAAGPVNKISDIQVQDIQTQDIQAWEALFFSFLEHKGITTDEYSISISENEITIETSNPVVSLAIEEALSSPDLTREKLRSALKLDIKAEGVILTSPKIDFNKASALDVLTRIFSKDVLRECGLPKSLLSTYDNVREKTLEIPISGAQGFDDLWKARLKILTAAMIGAGIKGMSDAYLHGNRAVSINPSPQACDAELAPAFQKVAGIRSQGQSLAFFINYHALLKLLFPEPPVVKKEQSAATSRWQIKINKDDAINYLIRTFQEGFILHRQGPNLRPIFLPRGKLVKSNNIISLVLDCSGSMSEGFGTYIDNVKALVVRILAKSAPGDILRIVNFSSDVNLKEFVLTDNASADRDRIFTHLKSLHAEGVTHLYDAVMQELKDLTAYPNYVQSLIIFTDGQHYIRLDNVREDPAVVKQQGEAFLTEYTGYMAARPSHQVPSVFTMGLGTQYSHEMLSMWARQAGVTHTHLQSIEDFKNIFSQLEKMVRPRLLVRFMQHLVEGFYSVYEGTLSMPSNLTIDPNQPFRFGDTTYQLTEVPRLSSAAAAAAAASSATDTSSRHYTPSFSGSEPDPVSDDEAGTSLITSFRNLCRMQ